jgi:hypothetical protein
MAMDCAQALKQIGPAAMKLPVVEFDENDAKGWRALEVQKCVVEAARPPRS